MNGDLIDRQAVDKIINDLLENDNLQVSPSVWHGLHMIKQLPSVQPTLYGYNIEHLELIARVLRKEGLPPERIAVVLTDIGRIVAMVIDEIEEAFESFERNCCAKEKDG